MKTNNRNVIHTDAKLVHTVDATFAYADDDVSSINIDPNTSRQNKFRVNNDTFIEGEVNVVGGVQSSVKVDNLQNSGSPDYVLRLKPSKDSKLTFAMKNGTKAGVFHELGLDKIAYKNVDFKAEAGEYADINSIAPVVVSGNTSLQAKPTNYSAVGFTYEHSDVLTIGAGYQNSDTATVDNNGLSLGLKYKINDNSSVGLVASDLENTTHKSHLRGAFDWNASAGSVGLIADMSEGNAKADDSTIFGVTAKMPLMDGELSMSHFQGDNDNTSKDKVTVSSLGYRKEVLDGLNLGVKVQKLDEIGRAHV